jgi:GT2 family glycosyltransferase
MSYCVVIPTINQKQLLIRALDWYITNNPRTQIIVLDNGKQGFASATPYIKVFESNKNLGVAGSWNWLIKKAMELGFENFLVLNDDVILKLYEGEVLDLIKAHDQNTFFRSRPFYNWSCYLINKHIFETVGEFDEGFRKCFFEDNDYEYRMRLSGVRIRYDDLLSPNFYENSASTKKDPSLDGYLENREYYVKKWGGLPSEEVFTTPFNQ